MFRKASILTAIVLVFSVYQVRVQATISHWDGGGDGHHWSDPENWSPNTVPDGVNFTVTIDGGSSGVDVWLSQDREIKSLGTHGDVELCGDWPDLTILDGLTNYGSLEIDEIEIYGNVTNTDGAKLGGNFDVYEGNVHNSGTIFLPPGECIWTGYQFENSGVIEMYDGTCSSDQAFENQSTGTIKGYGAIHSEQVIQNQGTIYAYAGSLAVASEGELINQGVLGNYPLSSLHIRPSLFTEPAADVNNFGTIEVNGGGGVSFDCNLVNEPNSLVSGPNGVIKLLGGTLAAKMITQAEGAEFEGFGSIAADILIDPNGLIKLTGPTNIVGDVNIPAGATLEISDGQTLITGHTICKGTIHLIGGTVIFQGGCDCNDCNITHNPGIDRNHFDINSDGIEDFKDFAYFADTWLWQASWY